MPMLECTTYAPSVHVICFRAMINLTHVVPTKVLARVSLKVWTYAHDVI